MLVVVVGGGEDWGRVKKAEKKKEQGGVGDGYRFTW